jgi:hypothetical protein
MVRFMLSCTRAHDTPMLRWACRSFGNPLMSSDVCDTALADVEKRRPLPPHAGVIPSPFGNSGRIGPVGEFSQLLKTPALQRIA